MQSITPPFELVIHKHRVNSVGLGICDFCAWTSQASAVIGDQENLRAQLQPQRTCVKQRVCRTTLLVSEVTWKPHRPASTLWFHKIHGLEKAPGLFPNHLHRIVTKSHETNGTAKGAGKGMNHEVPMSNHLTIAQLFCGQIPTIPVSSKRILN